MPDQAIRQRRRTFLYLWVLLALLILLVAATYTWFSLSQTPHVNDMSIYINSQQGIELATAYDAPDNEWSQHIDFEQIVSGDYPLKPVTWSNYEKKFYSMRYGFDGRMSGLFALSDEKNANRQGSEGYYVVGTFYARTDAECSVQLAEAIELNGGEKGAGTYVIGKPIWDPETISHYDGGNNADTAIRIGFRITHIGKDNGEPAGESEFFIYEPSCNYHINDPYLYYPTPSIDGTENLIDEDHLILQYPSSWSEAYPVQRNVTIKSLGKFMKNKQLFTISPDEKIRIDLYVWLEGQDIDCIAKIDDAKILASIQFNVEYGGYHGYDDIPE